MSCIVQKTIKIIKPLIENPYTLKKINTQAPKTGEKQQQEKNIIGYNRQVGGLKWTLWGKSKSIIRLMCQCPLKNLFG